MSENRLIDANALMDRLKFKRRISEVGLYRGLESAISQCAKAPTIDAVEVVHGRWEYIPMSEEDWQCTNCKEVFLIPPGCHPAADCGMHYCPNCGAKMDGDENV